MTSYIIVNNTNHSLISPYNLDLSAKGLKIIPYSIKGHVNLTHINLSNNKIKWIPNFIFNLPNLVYLDLSGNCIENIPNNIYKLHNLKTLKLNNNIIYDVDLNKLSLLPNLQELYLYDNPCQKYMNDITLFSNNVSLVTNYTKEKHAKNIIKLFVTKYVLPKIFDEIYEIVI